MQRKEITNMTRYPNNEKDIKYDVYCDGDLLTYCVLADDEYDIAICIALDSKGVPMYDPKTGRDKYYLIMGDVEFKITNCKR
jgi:hypothetical protein